jgi:hypothetical protein
VHERCIDGPRVRENPISRFLKGDSPEEDSVGNRISRERKSR